MRSCLIAAMTIIASACSTDEPPQRGVDIERVRSHVEFLASDAMEGRGAGYAGERAAADYIAQEFKAAGLVAPDKGYIQPFDFLPVGGVEPFAVMQARNVVGVLRGGERAGEVIVVGAHYDGQGKRGDAAAGRFNEAEAASDEIWNSASDNAVSIGAMIEIARTLARGPTPARTIIFVAFSGEESRLNGAFNYVHRPAAPLARHVAMINLEKLVGHEETQLITATDGSSPRFAKIAQAASAASGLAVESFYNGVITDTDHFAFIAAGVPALVIGTGAYEKVHGADDEIATLRLEDLPPRFAYVLNFVEALARDAAPLAFAADKRAYSGVAGGATTDAETAACGLSTPGFLATAIAVGLPGERSGLKVGDVIVGVNGAAVSFGEDGANFLEDVAALDWKSELEIRCGDRSSMAVIDMPTTVNP